MQLSYFKTRENTKLCTNLLDARKDWHVRGSRVLSRLALLTGAVCALLASGFTTAQAPPDSSYPVLNPAWTQRTCPLPEDTSPQTETERQQQSAYTAYAEVLPLYFARVHEEPDDTLLVPVEGVRVAQVSDTFGAPRSGGRTHAGLDIFAPRGTPVYSSTGGFVWAISDVNIYGGNAVTVVGAGGRRYYYAHLDGFAPELQEGQYVTPETVLGYVGTTGNAETTPPHVHFEVADGLTCDWNIINPFPLLEDR